MSNKILLFITVFKNWTSEIPQKKKNELPPKCWKAPCAYRNFERNCQAVFARSIASVRLLQLMHSSHMPTEQALSKFLQPILIEVETHPVFAKIQTVKQLHVFMEHHVFAVWDFMSLLKFLQNTLAPSTWPWLPPLHGNLVRLINEIVLAEECDQLPQTKSSSNASYASHFNLYLQAMEEVGANTHPILAFIERLKVEGLVSALSNPIVPEASRMFMKDTFALLECREPHKIAAAFAFGRENVIPGMFHSLLEKFGISPDRAPIFHYYLQRHTELDGEEHGPAALRLVTTLCKDSPEKIEEATASAQKALLSRKQLLDSVNLLI